MKTIEEMIQTHRAAHTPVAPQPHGNQIGAERRYRLGGGPCIDLATFASLKAGQDRGTSYGLQIDRLVSFAKSQGFDPVTNQKNSAACPKARRR